MLRHIVVMKWHHPLSEDELAEVRRSLEHLRAEAGMIRALAHGPDLGIRSAGADYALTIDFDDADGWRSYSEHPAHEVPRAVLARFVSAQMVIQIPLGEDSEERGPGPA
jgi:Stress responsive A/B Barrel Domain